MMKVVILLGLLSVSCARKIKTTTESQEPQIIGGEPTDIKFFPHQLSLRLFDVHICGASIIAERWTLTAAHCIDETIPVSNITFLAGSTNRSDTSIGLIATATQYYFHPDYIPGSYDYDVAIVAVNKPFIGENMQIIKLTTQMMPLYEGHNVKTSGWGISEEDTLPHILHMVEMPIVSPENCKNDWTTATITDSMICAGKANLDTCSGDNGGALIYCSLQVGINLFSSQNCDGKQPAVFANLANPSIRSFIRRLSGV